MGHAGKCEKIFNVVSICFELKAVKPDQGKMRQKGGAVDFQNEIAYNKLEVLWTIIDYGRLRYGYKKATATI